MKSYRLKIRPLSAFGTDLLGDTLFGQMCWAVRNRYGEDRLEKLLQGYTSSGPFAIISNAFPTGFIPCPTLPAIWFVDVPDTQRKEIKKRTWMPLDKVSEPLARWQQHCQTDKDVLPKSRDGKTISFLSAYPQPHNSIDRCTGTTKGIIFAPYSLIQKWYAKDIRLDIYLLLDEGLFSSDETRTCLEDIGRFGYGRDASIGLGKYVLEAFDQINLPTQQDANACLTLAPCAPQRLGFNADRSFYQLFTRFGRHGDMAVHKSGQPFKNPVLMAQAGAVFTTELPEQGWIGQGLGGEGQLSKSIAGTIQQGYSPVVSVHLPQNAG